MLLTTQLNKP